MTGLLPALVLGLLTSAWLPGLPGWPWQLAMALAVALLALKGRAPGRIAAAGGVGLLAGIVFGEALLTRHLPQHCVREPVWVEGRVVSLPRVRQFDADTRQQRFELLVDSLVPAHCAGPRRLLLAYYGEHDIAPGARWRFEVLLKRPWGLVNPGSFNMQAWFAQTGIDATGSIRSRADSALNPGSPGSAERHHRARALVSERIASLGLPAETQAVLQSVTVADRSALGTRTWRLFQAFGLNHLLVISGLHIGLLAGLGYGLGRLLLLPVVLAGQQRIARYLPSLLALLLAAGYAALAGFSLATSRALLMLACAVTAGALGRAVSGGHSLLLAAVILLLANPLAGLGSGFWLSFGAVACLLWRLQWQTGEGRAAGLLGTHSYMALAMVPLAGGWFGGASLVSAPANLLAVPLLGLYVVPLSIAATVCALAGWSLDGRLAGGLADQLATTFWTWAAAPVSTLLPLGQSLLDSRPAWLYWRFSPTPPELALAAVAVIVAVIPGQARKWLAVMLLLAPALLPSTAARTASAEAVHLLFLDVGQGTAVLLYNRDQALLYDTGGGVAGGPTVADSVILPLLRERGIGRLDTLVLSHGDSDHSAGWRDIVDGVEVDRILTGADLRAQGFGQPCVAGQSWTWRRSNVRFQVLAPAMDAGNEPGATPLSKNNGSCVLKLMIGTTAVLLPGDVDSDRERALVRYWGASLRSDWLLAAHHGSNSSSGYAFLKQVAPADVVIGAGYANRFGHPHPAVLARLGKGGTRVWHTARDGALELVFQPGEGPQLVAHRHQRQFYWR